MHVQLYTSDRDHWLDLALCPSFFFWGTREGGEPFLLHVQWEVGWLDTIRLIEYMTAARRQRSCALMQGVLGIVHLQFWI
jgi:hypothetical protein